MTFPSDSPFYSRPEHTHPPLAYVTASPGTASPIPMPSNSLDDTLVPRAHLEEWYRTLNEYVVSDSDPGGDVLEDLRDQIYSYLRG
jgi:hypothetical protein